MLFVGILLITGLLSVNGLCGFEYGYMAKQTGKIGKEWPCKCIGFKQKLSDSYTTKDYCTGINLSNNKLNRLLFKNQQYPTNIN